MVVARLLLGCSIPTQLPTYRFIGMRAPPEVTGPTASPFQKYRTQQVLHICYAVDM